MKNYKKATEKEVAHDERKASKWKQGKLKRADRKELLRCVSNVLGRNGEAELERLVDLNLIPVIVGEDGEWYTEDHPDDCPSLAEAILADVSLTAMFVKMGLNGTMTALERLVDVVSMKWLRHYGYLQREINWAGETSAVVEQKMANIMRLTAIHDRCGPLLMEMVPESKRSKAELPND
jgi:hypothetical protein